MYFLKVFESLLTFIRVNFITIVHVSKMKQMKKEKRFEFGQVKGPLQKTMFCKSAFLSFRDDSCTLNFTQSRKSFQLQCIKHLSLANYCSTPSLLSTVPPLSYIELGFERQKQ